MLSVDIETMGLEHQHPMTMVCLYDPEQKIQKAYPFVACLDSTTFAVTNHDLFHTMCEDLVNMLDAADSICCYNGIEFDLPFIAAKCLVSDQKLAQWILKTVDVFFTVKYTIHRFYKLDRLLACNKFACKSGSGKQAIELAKSGDIQSLKSYCMMDAKLTWDLTQKEQVFLPHLVQGKPLVWRKNCFFVG